MKRGHRESSVFMLYCMSLLAPISGSRVLDLCIVTLPATGQNSCNTAWVIDVTSANLAPFTNCEDKSSSDGVRTNELGAVDSRHHPGSTANKSVCAQIDIDIADVTYFSVHVCKCLDCSLETKATVLHSRDVWLESGMYKPGFPSVARPSRQIYCLWQLMAKTPQTSCHIQADPSRHIIMCRTESAYSENGCFRIWLQHKLCEGYLTCKALSSTHSCDSLFEKRVRILQPPTTSETSIAFMDLKLSKLGMFPGRNSTEPGVLSTDVSRSRENTYSGFYPCLNCSTVTARRQKRGTACPPGSFGLACNQDCHCRNKKTCHSNGTCLSGMCATGWMGITCSLRECPAGRYGLAKNDNRTCEANCSCPENTECNVVHGACSLTHCLNITSKMAQTFDCFQMVCPRRKLMVSNCSDTCQCSQDNVCDSISGRCPTPVCKGIYEPPNCSTFLKTKAINWQSGILNATEFFLIVLKVVLVLKVRLLPSLVRSLKKAKKQFISD